MLVLVNAGIRTIADVVSLAPDSANISGFSSASIKKLQAAAVHAIPGCFNAERVIDHKKAANPYDSLHGETWRSEILTTVALKGSVSIQTMMTHIFITSAAAFVGTKFADSFLVYHDALSQLTAGATKAWMKIQFIGARSYFEIWIKPEGGLNAGTIFADRPPGNSPELMPMDSSLNKDCNDCVARHISYCSLMAPTHPDYNKRFCRSTPALNHLAFSRVWDVSLGPEAGAPTGIRIVQDCMKFFPAVRAIYEARGICVQGLGTREGHRKTAAAGLNKRGGKRVKGVDKGTGWVHPDAVGPRRMLMARAVERHAEQTGIQLPLTAACATPVAVAPLTEPHQTSPDDVRDIAIFLAGLS
jgi:hypothetical protein